MLLRMHCRGLIVNSYVVSDYVLMVLVKGIVAVRNSKSYLIILIMKNLKLFVYTVKCPKHIIICFVLLNVYKHKNIK